MDLFYFAHIILVLTLLSDFKAKILQIFVAFSENLNFSRKEIMEQIFDDYTGFSSLIKMFISYSGDFTCYFIKFWTT